MRKRGGSAGDGTVTKEKFERLAPPGLSGITGQWLAFWELADVVGSHYAWRGQRVRGRPAFLPNSGPALPARQLAWVFDLRELRAGEYLRPSCGRATCIRPDHQEVVRGGR